MSRAAASASTRASGSLAHCFSARCSAALARQGHQVRRAHLHALGRDIPARLLQVDLRPLGAAQLGGSHEGERQQLQRGAGYRAAVVGLDRSQERAELLRLGQSREVLRLVRLERASQRRRWVLLGAPSSDGVAEDAARPHPRLRQDDQRAAPLHRRQRLAHDRHRDLPHRHRADMRIQVRRQRGPHAVGVAGRPHAVLRREPLLGQSLERLR